MADEAKRYVIDEKGVAKITAVDFGGSAFSINASATHVLSAEDLMKVGMRIVAIACAKLEADCLDRDERNAKFNALADSVEAWAKENGLELRGKL